MKIEWEQRVRVSESAPLSLVAACCQAAEGVAPVSYTHLTLPTNSRV